MISKHVKFLAVIAVAAVLGQAQAHARDDFVLKIPLRSRLSPVQRLNREGVELVRKNQYEKAEALFLKAYLFDPADPFTLNNLGYVAELQGQVDRAQRFYRLAAEQGCDAPIDLSSMRDLKGRPMQDAYQNYPDLPMRINRMNLDAMQLLAQDRGFAALTLLEHARAADPQNPFTLNNLAVADEAVGDYDAALQNYKEVADLHSSEKVTVTADRAWRGKSVSAMARASAERLEKRIDGMPAEELEAIKLNVRGVFEANQNQTAAADEDFLRAYSIDPGDAFSLNNRAYVAERQGDLETAQFYYAKAGKGDNAGSRVGLATKAAAEGDTLFRVASDSNGNVDRALQVYSQERREQSAPVELTPRGPGARPESAPQPAPARQPAGNAPPAPGSSTPQP